MRRVALIYDARHAYDCQVMIGVARYVQENPDFNVYLERDALKDQRLPRLSDWKGDGVIANFDHPRIAAAVSASKLPAVGFGSGYGWRASAVPYFFTNNQAIAQMAADHFLTRGFRNFAYCGYIANPINGWSQEREHAFTRCLKARGHSCNVYRDHFKTSRHWGAEQRSIGEWLLSLPKPVALMAANDTRGQQVLETCRVFGLIVPEQVAVMGVNNDEMLCQLSSPPLTSIVQGTEKMGYEAAALLDQMMRGEKPRRQRFTVNPVKVVTRYSTDLLAVPDNLVSRAMMFVSANALKGIKVSDVTHALATSRSGLEARFYKVLGFSIHAAIRRTQMDRVRSLISDSTTPLKQIAASTGFRSVQHMTTLFKKSFALSPAKYRLSLQRDEKLLAKPPTAASRPRANDKVLRNPASRRVVPAQV
jgi:LacI family transcriptional regulator